MTLAALHNAALHNVVNVRGRFHRSIQLVRDWRDVTNLREYLLTTTARELASQMLSQLAISKGERAWSITGPYGTGKSAFALFLADLLTHDPPAHAEARSLRDALGFQAPPFVPILVVGRRTPIVPAFLFALAEGVSPFAPALAHEVSEALKVQHISNKEVIAFVEQATEAAKTAGYGGMLFVVDEFGKFLEYTALHPEEQDLLVVQHLAETAARSAIPILLITILHTSFAEYLHAADEVQRAEWQKVQGRFVDVAYQEPPEQLFGLIGAAIERNMSPGLEAAYSQAIDDVLQSSALVEAGRRLPIKDLLPACVPLHPVSVLLLWPLFRSKLAQNERSLFAFLTAHEPFGFQEFLASATCDEEQPPFYRVDRLYDYITTALGAAIYMGDHARRWAEIDYAIHRVPTHAPPLARAVVKAVGLIGMYGAPVGLRASKETVILALGHPDMVSDALVYLENASILVYRRHEGAYGLWEGSDIALDVCVEEARRHVGEGNLADRLKQAVTLRPIVARAHYIRTGTLRYFTVDIINGTEQALHQALEAPIAPADGQIVYVLTPSRRDRKLLIELAEVLTKLDSPERHLRILAFPKPVIGLEQAVLEVESWRWVSENVQALQGDYVARQEVRARILRARDRLENIIGRVLGLSGQPFDPTASEWVQGGSLRNPRSARAFLRWLSVLCDEVFDQSPIFRNELLNRDRLSSAAAAARRNLLDAMLKREKEPSLGLTGTPAEVSMYRSLLAEGGFHGERDGQWEFGEPGSEWQPVWRAIHQFLATTQVGRRPLTDLISILRHPPLGLREGPLPILLCAVLLAHRDDVALYEDGVFVPELRIEVFERLMRVPKAFEIQQYTLDRHEQDALAAVSEVIRTLQLRRDETVTSQLLEVVKPLVVFAAHLPPYTKNTKQRIEPPQAAAVREALLKARDPYMLMFAALPAALEVSLDQAASVPRYVQLLRDCLVGLQRAYPRLLDEIEAQLREVFDLRGTSEEARLQLQRRAAPLEGHAADRTLALFVREASRVDMRDWREVLGRVINGGMPPLQWHDADMVSFQVRLRALASDFIRLEELVAEQQHTGAAQILRIGLLDGHIQETREVIAVTPERAPAITSLADRIVALLEEEADQSEESRRIRLAALAQAAARYLRRNGGDEDE